MSAASATATEPASPGAVPVPPGVRWARLAGVATGAFLALRAIAMAVTMAAEGKPGWVAYHLGVLAFGVLLVLPWRRVPEAWFKRAFAVLVCGTVAFAFGQIAEALFGIYALAAIGKKFGLPAFQGTLVFLALMQVPAILFERRPDLLR